MNFKPTIQIGLVSAVVLLSGCTTSTPQPLNAEDASVSPSNELEVVLHHKKFHIDAASPFGHTVPNQTFITPYFNATPDAMAILVEVAWNDTFQDLDAELKFKEDIPCHTGFPSAACTVLDPTGHPQALVNNWLGQDVGQFKNRDGLPGAPDSPSRILVERDTLRILGAYCEENCTWFPSLENKGPFVDLEFHLFVSVFYGQAPPPGYTAIPWLT